MRIATPQQSRRRAAKAGWIDISVTLHSGMVHWPSDPAVVIERTSDLAHGDPATVSRLSMGSHTGTHLDAPLHFIRSGKGLDEMPLDTTIGPARVIAIQDPESIRPQELRRHHVRSGERLMFKTRNSAQCWRTDRFVEDFVSLSPEAAHFLAQRRVRLVGIDYLSVGSYREHNGAAVHRALLGAGVWILEGIHLARVRPGRYELICLPLKILASDGSPARAILIPSNRTRSSNRPGQQRRARPYA